MKKILKKFAAAMLAFVMLAGVGVAFAGCGGNKENQVMSLSVNPGVEFIVDGNDKVVSVTANNEDGAYILQKYTEFTGMSAKDAALKFLELSEKYGFVVEGTTDGEKFTISVSGQGAEKLYNDVKNNISSKANELGLSIANMVKIGEDELEEIVAQCYQELSEDYIDELSEKELVDLVKQSREETKEILTDDEKQAYYRERAQKVISAKLEAINDYLDENATLANLDVQMLATAMNTTYNNVIVPAFNSINTEINKLYNTALTGIDAVSAKYVEQKEAYLAKVEEYRTAIEQNGANVEQLKTEMVELKNQAETIWEGLEEARENAKEQLENLLEGINSSLATLNSQINSVMEKISLTATQLQTKVNEQINALKTEYENSSVNPWAK